jgi:hypothetical protein
MSPLIQDQSTLRVQSRAFYWPGDILTFLDRSGRLTTHRLLGVFPRNGELRCLTQPDSLERPDATIPLTQVLGKVTGGECEPEAIRIPWLTRLGALKRFSAHALRRLLP